MIRVSPSCFLAGLLRVSASPLCAIEFLKLTCFVAQNRSEVVSRNAPKFTRNGEKNGKSVGKVVLVPNEKASCPVQRPNRPGLNERSAARRRSRRFRRVAPRP